jgi:hypothetical protein
MKHLIDDVVKLGRASTGLLAGLSVKGRLLNVINVCRPNWPDAFRAKAANYLSAQAVKQPHKFVAMADYLSYIEVQLNRYAAQNPVVEVFPVADDLGLKRWELRWQASRQRPDKLVCEPWSGARHAMAA